LLALNYVRPLAFHCSGFDLAYAAPPVGKLYHTVWGFWENVSFHEYSDTEYRFTVNSPRNAMEKMLYTLNLSRLDAAAEISETTCGYLLVHGSNEFWTRKQA